VPIEHMSDWQFPIEHQITTGPIDRRKNQCATFECYGPEGCSLRDGASVCAVAVRLVRGAEPRRGVSRQ